MNYDVKVI